MKRAATTLMLMLAVVASAGVEARALASEGQKTQWAPTRNLSSLNARAVFASESGAATSPYAGEAAKTAAAAKEAGFTGHREESALGLTYAKRRWQDPLTGTWFGRDDVGAASYLQSPNELNPWQYAAGNPIRFTDPSGRFVLDAKTGAGRVVDFDAPWYSFPLDGSNKRDSTERLELLVSFLSRNVDQAGFGGFQKYLNQFVGARAVAESMGWAEDDVLYRSQLRGALEGYFNDPETASERQLNMGMHSYVGSLNAMSAAQEGAEATKTLASLLGVPTDSTELKIAAATPFVAGALRFGMKKGLKTLRYFLGRNADDGARALNDVAHYGRTQQHSGAPFNTSQPVFDEATSTVIKKQVDSLGCGPTCGQALLRMRGIVASQRRVALAGGQSATSYWFKTSSEVLQGLERLDPNGGWKAQFFGSDWLNEARRLSAQGPWMATTKEFGNSGHFVVVEGFEEATGRLRIHDPSQGTTYTMEPQAFSQLWTGEAVFRTW